MTFPTFRLTPIATVARAVTLATAMAAILTLSACAQLAPAYSTPAAPIPSSWPDAAASTPSGTAPATDAGKAMVPATDWTSVISDPQLRKVIDLALANNRDLRIATLNIEQARATYRIQEAAQLPTLNASATDTVKRTPAQANGGQASLSRQYGAEVGLTSYELDLFGRVRNLKDAALQSYLNTEEAQRSTRLSLIAEVATAWLTLSADQAQLALAQQTLVSQQDSYERTQQSQRLGGASALTTAQARTTVESARNSVASYTAQVKQDRNALALLVGAAVPTGLLPAAMTTDAATQLSMPPDGLPSSVLQRRPDVLAAEHLLIAANANIGAARAALFPTISLTATAGTASTALSDLFKGGAWSFIPSISLPIFDGGSSRASLDSAKAARDIQLATYEKTVQTAFSEVADALAVRSTLAERLASQQALVDAYQEAFTLADARFKNGADSYLTVLDAQRSLFSARQTLVTLRLLDQTNRVTLYKVLGGGGWPAAAGAKTNDS
ncbi:outer membrane protein, multidrug efflux system [Roseateles sp. YR242]|uniref:efflux transporter outer membrane subunit n=1 Tax=Roseateles sp. YR242 TaxID=1855305 RepID=UPI0008D51921|nr:efflux transporter outer membrane subunit [Roseateles sp. YR242]SEL69654.1 outer membrane protein, multidrug efflux system [Roseateles sp. YR242]